MKSHGIVIGCDQNLEYLIPVWFSFYSTHNNLPVTFVDFGVSKEMQSFCKKHFNFIELNEIFTESKDVSLENQIKWESLYSNEFWNFRSQWFKKPHACLLSPYDYSLWVDVDCLVYKNLSHLFSEIQDDVVFSIRAEGLDQIELEKSMQICFQDETTFNSGVILYSNTHPILKLWKEKSLNESHLFIGDQHALSRAIYESNSNIIPLPNAYNWSYAWKDHPEIMIHHFHGAGKILMIEKFLVFHK